MQTTMHGHEGGVSVTNHFYLMASDPGPVRTIRDVGYDRICHDIRNALAGLSLHSMTMDEIWRCIQQVEGYTASCWMAILGKLDIPEDRWGELIRVIADASRDRQLRKFPLFWYLFPTLADLHFSLYLVL
jgi:hypothetical protein